MHKEKHRTFECFLKIISLIYVLRGYYALAGEKGLGHCCRFVGVILPHTVSHCCRCKNGGCLYNVFADPEERVNLSDDPTYKAILDDMLSTLAKYQAGVAENLSDAIYLV